MRLIDGEAIVTDQISTLPTPGHTPGHQVILISSQGEKAMVVGDVLHNVVQVQEPEWCASVDINKDDSRSSREKVLSKAEGYTIAGPLPPGSPHWPIVRMSGRRYWQALYLDGSQMDRHTGRIVRMSGRRYWQAL